MDLHAYDVLYSPYICSYSIFVQFVYRIYTICLLYFQYLAKTSLLARVGFALAMNCPRLDVAFIPLGLIWDQASAWPHRYVLMTLTVSVVNNAMQCSAMSS